MTDYRNFDFDEEGRDDVIRREIEAEAQDEADFWDYMAAEMWTATFDSNETWENDEG